MSTGPIREALVNLLSAKLRSFLAILGVLVGTASVVALISSSQLATAHALAQFKSLGTNLLSLYIRNKQNTTSGSQQERFTMDDVHAMQKAIPEIKESAPYTMLFQPMIFKDNSINGEVIGATTTFKNITKIQMQRGRFISFMDKGNFFCILGSKLAKKIESDGWDPMYKELAIGKHLFKVIGVMKPWPSSLFVSADLNQSVIIPINTAYYVSKNVQISNLLLKLQTNPDLAHVKKKVNDFIKTNFTNKAVTYISPEQIIHLISKQRETSTWLLIAIGAISLVVGGIGVMNIMLVSVIERRREIGIRMAIGARQQDILRMFLVESIMLTLFGGFLGIIVGVLVSYLLTVFTKWQFYFYGLPVILGFVVSVIVGILSGFYPAWRASRLDPIQCLSAD